MSPDPSNDWEFFVHETGPLQVQAAMHNKIVQ